MLIVIYQTEFLKSAMLWHRAFALLWVDAHPAVSIPEDFAHHHAHVLANLLGVGDEEFVAEVARLFKPEQVLYVGLNDMMVPINSNPMKNMKLDMKGFRSLLVAYPRTYEEYTKITPQG